MLALVTTQIVQDMVNIVDMDGTGIINFPEFLKMMCIKVDAENFEDQVREAFLVFDQVRLLPLK